MDDATARVRRRPVQGTSGVLKRDDGLFEEGERPGPEGASASPGRKLIESAQRIW